ncbi:hypothetical protein V1508DRAFT_427193 [Lipomyces doorenjongii]|uniref:uncharacterized protein n=1 Tax=Lipomyces doorenjongii TaxID=383834 RepID=UPI0034D01425
MRKEKRHSRRFLRPLHSTMTRDIKGFFHDLDIYSFNVGAIACSPSKVDSEVLFEDFHLEWSNARVIEP